MERRSLPKALHNRATARHIVFSKETQTTLLSVVGILMPKLSANYCERSEQPLPKGGTGQQTKPNFTQPDFGERRFVLLGRYLALILIDPHRTWYMCTYVCRLQIYPKKIEYFTLVSCSYWLAVHNCFCSLKRQRPSDNNLSFVFWALIYYMQASVMLFELVLPTGGVNRRVLTRHVYISGNGPGAAGPCSDFFSAGYSTHRSSGTVHTIFPLNNICLSIVMYNYSATSMAKRAFPRRWRLLN